MRTRVLIHSGSFGYGGTNAHVIVEDIRGYLQSWESRDSS